MCRDEGLIDDARQSYKKMKRKGIGADAAAFYVQWSQLEASDGDASQARAILHKARERCGQADQARVQQALASVDQLEEEETRSFAAETPVARGRQPLQETPTALRQPFVRLTGSLVLLRTQQSRRLVGRIGAVRFSSSSRASGL